MNKIEIDENKLTLVGEGKGFRLGIYATLGNEELKLMTFHKGGIIIYKIPEYIIAEIKSHQGYVPFEIKYGIEEIWRWIEMSYTEDDIEVHIMDRQMLMVEENVSELFKNYSSEFGIPALAEILTCVLCNQLVEFAVRNINDIIEKGELF